MALPSLPSDLSVINGVTTRYTYDAAGRLVKEGSKTYRYGYLDKVLSVTDGDTKRTFTCHADGQLATANYGDSSESFSWDGLALIQRGDEQFINEPHVGGGNPVVSSKGTSYFNDMLGTTVGSKTKGRKYSAAALTAFGERLDNADTTSPAIRSLGEGWFTGKPFVEGLGHAFLFRNYRASLGKWQTADPLGYPDGWNRLGYCACNPVNAYDLCGGETVVVGSFYDALYHYAYGNGTSATIANSIMLQVLATESFFEDVLGGIVSRLASVPHDQYSDSFSLSGRIRWEQGDVLGRTSTSWNVTINWTATNWQIADSGEFEWRRIDGVGIVHLSTDDDWDFKAHENDPWWRTIFDEYMAGSCADLFSYIRTGNKGKPYHLSGVADVDASKCAYQFRALE